ncbi:DNA-binding NarL/FixJ family response regulator [Filimonas zeae]|uniref:DNA-binding response regulator n=1 Tax=Filimonas zeae TaxID=1737353 RepID=A0A917MSZ8_9BACT|nr:response regulator transcription factor [Filimonas zeae]MDR6338119.1 DNA-binding NarL/FixJ family response regulator [Filimonas zeae]GGH61816.1 DNA-binding response regulator [Filimonas zeae]
MSHKVFITDDHFMIVEGIRSLLQNEPGIHWMGHAMDAASCLEFLKTQQPDVILMDINLPDQKGTALCKTVKTLYPQVQILGLSTYNQQPVIRDMLSNGASGYLLKNASKEELIDAIDMVAAGGEYLCMEAAESLKNKVAAKPIITKREREILHLICDGLTNPEIAEKLFISLPTANTHRKSLLAKFGAKNVASLVKMAVEGGLV